MGMVELSLQRNPPFFPRSQKEGSRGVIVEVLGPGAYYLYIYWAWSQNPKVQIHSNFSKKEMN